jgi:hypothetical protein
MNSIGPIALIHATDLTRRAVRGAGPDGAATPERPRSRTTHLRLAQRSAAAQSGSDQCRIVAAPRKPARA